MVRDAIRHWGEHGFGPWSIRNRDSGEFMGRGGLLPDLVAFTQVTNHRSRRVMEKAGFRFEREFMRMDESHLLSRVTRSEWP